MARQKTQKTARTARKRKKNGEKKKAPLLKFEIIGLVLIFAGIFAALSIMGVDTGSVGYSLDGMLAYGFGFGRIVAALAAVVLGLKYIMLRRPCPLSAAWAAGAWVYALFLTFIHLVFIPEGTELMPASLRIGGGFVGAVLSLVLRDLFGQFGAVMAVVLAAAATLLIWKKWSISRPVTIASHKASEEMTKMSGKAAEGLQDASAALKEWHRPRFFDIQKEEARENALEARQPAPSVGSAAVPDVHEIREVYGADRPDEDVIGLPPYDEPAAAAGAEEEKPEPEEPAVPASPPQSDGDQPAMPEADEEDGEADGAVPAENTVPDVLDEELARIRPVEVERTSAAADVGPVGSSAVPKAQGEKTYRLPPVTMLQHGQEQHMGLSDEVRQNARILQETLQSFNIEAKILNASQGPAVTRYELEPAAGVKVSKIVHLADDLALKLAATDIRIEAPIPGKAAIGIEVPNKKLSGVMLRDVLDTDAFRLAAGGVPVSLGKDIAGNPVIADLTKMPHLLVAGSTGSGKSVCINTFIASILFKQRPEDVKLILIDPKVVELSNYNGLPHLLTPVVTDPKKAASVLRWAVREMDDRYKRFALTKTRDISRFNELHPDEAMPFIVIIIDELADLMMVASGDVEESICRLAQKARACGMHLVLATQRPSVDVLTGLIKANVPSRIAFAVSSQVDSRTILDMAGAEKLIGKGDMLFYPMGASKPLRVQGAFISDSEIDKLVEFIKAQSHPQYNDAVQQAQTESRGGGEFFEDELMQQALEMVLETGQASASMLQRRFRIGYTRAARLIDTMEAMGVVGANNGSKSREILMTADEVQQKYLTPM